MKPKFKSGPARNATHNVAGGFTLIELAISLGILFVLSAIVLGSLGDFRKNGALDKDTETIVETLRQARTQTLSSQNSYSYGVHFTGSKITLFVGTSYDSSTTTNRDFSLSSGDTVLTINLTDGGNNVVFQRLSGETTQNGTVVVSSSGLSRSKTVTIYKTGLVEYQ